MGKQFKWTAQLDAWWERRRARLEGRDLDEAEEEGSLAAIRAGRPHLPLTITLRRIFPQHAKQVDYGRSMKSAIRLKCLDCAGAISEVRKCDIYDCPLWSFRPSQDPNKNPMPEGVLPTEEMYDEWIESNPRQLAARKRATATGFVSTKSDSDDGDDGDEIVLEVD